MKREIILIFIALIVTIISSCSLFQSEVDSVKDLLPRDSDVPGWVRIDTPLYYNGNKIKKYNREYAGYEIEKIASCLYQSIDDQQIKVKLEVIKFNSVLNAYGFFSIKRGSGIFEAENINEFYSNSISLIQIGEYVIYSQTEQVDSLLQKDLKTFVNIPLIYISQNYLQDKLPDSLRVLKGKDGYGVLYSHKPNDRFPFVANINFTQWSWSNDLIDVFFNENESFYDAYEIFKKTIDNNYIMISSDNTYTAYKKEKDNRYSFISITDKWVFGCWSVKNLNDGKKVLSEILSRIQYYKKKEVLRK